MIIYRDRNRKNECDEVFEKVEHPKMMGQSVKIIYLHAVFCVGVFGEGEQLR